MPIWVTVTGDTASGKTAIARAIHQALKDQGFPVDLNDGPDNIGNEEDPGNEKQEERVKFLVERPTAVAIETCQINRAQKVEVPKGVREKREDLFKQVGIKRIQPDEFYTIKVNVQRGGSQRYIRGDRPDAGCLGFFDKQTQVAKLIPVEEVCFVDPSKGWGPLNPARDPDFGKEEGNESAET